jgi:hypothetical protein
MSELRCERISDGLRASEAIAEIQDRHGRRHFIRVERDFLTSRGTEKFLPIGIVTVDPRQRLVLVELPHEAETGANRLWIKMEQLDEPVEVYA